MNDLSGIHGGGSIISQLTHVYHGNSIFETVPENVSNGWNVVVDQVYDEIKRFLSPRAGNQVYYPYQYNSALKIISNFEDTNYYKNVLRPKQERMAVAYRAVIEKLREK